MYEMFGSLTGFAPGFSGLKELVTDFLTRARGDLFLSGSVWVFTKEEAAEVADACDFAVFADRHRLEPKPFAADALGDLWVFTRRGSIRRIDTQSLMLEREYADVVAWVMRFLSERDEEAGLGVLEDWEDVGGSLPAGHRPTPKVPFASGGTYDPENLVSAPIADNLASRWQAMSFLQAAE